MLNGNKFVISFATAGSSLDLSPRSEPAAADTPQKPDSLPASSRPDISKPRSYLRLIARYG